MHTMCLFTCIFCFRQYLFTVLLCSLPVSQCPHPNVSEDLLFHLPHLFSPWMVWVPESNDLYEKSVLYSKALMFSTKAVVSIMMLSTKAVIFIMMLSTKASLSTIVFVWVNCHSIQVVCRSVLSKYLGNNNPTSIQPNVKITGSQYNLAWK